MKEERLAVLKLLENGVINVDEAERLLNTLRPAETEKIFKKDETVAAINEKLAQTGENIANFTKKAGQTIGKTAEAAAKKAEPVIKKAEPVIKKAAEKIGEKTEEVCTGAKDFIERKKAEREKSFVPDIDDKDFECVCESEEEAITSEDSENVSETESDAQ